ncbi:MAG: tRNA (guanosine(46)-N7)-methyltransferase TrmB [Candidatus Margulisiibacteriota bacterium]
MRIRTHANPFHFIHKLEPREWDRVFPTFSGDLQVEVGFGLGTFIQTYAEAHPEACFVAMDIREQVVTNVQKRLTEADICNVHLIYSTAERVFADLIPEASVSKVFVFHPDPWFKKRHHKRRVINPGFLDLISPKLKPNARLYVSTDVEPLWEAMAETLNHHPDFAPVQEPEFWESYYKTNWQHYSTLGGRTGHSGVFEKQSK